MTDTSINPHYDPERDRAVVTIMTSDGRSRSHALDAKALDRFLGDLARVREQMREKIPANFTLQVRGVFNPPWSVGYASHNGTPHPYFTFLHTGFGWQGVMLKPDDARLLAQQLTIKANECEDGTALRVARS